MNVGQGYIPPQNVQPQHAPNPAAPADLRSKIVEILSNTANGCLTELGYWPGMPQKMNELQQTNVRYEQENLKLWQDNRILTQELTRIKETTQNDLRLAEAEVHRVRSEKQALLQQHSGDLHYSQLLTDHQTLQAFYNAACTEIKQLRDYIDRYISRQPFSAQSSPTQAHSASNTSSPTVTTIHSHPITRRESSGQMTYPPGPIYPPVPSQPVTMGHPPHPPPHFQSPNHPTHQRRRSSGQNVVPSPDHVNGSRPSSRPSSSASNSQRRVSRGSIPMPHEPPPPSLLAERPPPLRIVTTHQPTTQVASSHQSTPISAQPGSVPSSSMPPPALPPPPSATVPSYNRSRASTPVTPATNKPSTVHAPSLSDAVNPVQRRSAFAPFTSGGQPNAGYAITATSSQGSSNQSSSSSDVPLAQELAKRQRTVSSPSTDDHQIKKPRIQAIGNQTQPESSSHGEVASRVLPHLPLHAALMGPDKASSPVVRQEELPVEGQGLPQPQQQPTPLELNELQLQVPQVSLDPLASEQMIVSTETQDEEGEEVELDEDGLYPVMECLAQIMKPDSDRPNMQFCALCVARFAQGHLSVEPTAFVDATTEELINHCTTEHLQVWQQLRQPE